MTQPGAVPRRLRVIGIGPGGPDQVTVEAVAAMRSCDWFLVADKSVAVRGGEVDPLVVARRAILDRHVGPAARVVAVDDPPRERRTEFVGDETGYHAAVRAWHTARTDRYVEALRSRPGNVGFLVWGDPAFYDSTLRVLDRVVDALTATGEPAELDVLPGISAFQLLAARHRVVLHEVGRPLHVTTGRALVDALDAGQENLVVMLNASLEVLGDPRLAGWSIRWGANLGTESEELVAGTVGDSLTDIRAARARAEAAAGWVMDVFHVSASHQEVRGPQR